MFVWICLVDDQLGCLGGAPFLQVFNALQPSALVGSQDKEHAKTKSYSCEYYKILLNWLQCIYQLAPGGET